MRRAHTAGTHRGQTPDEIEALLGTHVAGTYRVVNHDAYARDTLRHLGETPLGGPKLVAPGCAGIDTVLHLHSAHMVAHPRATWGVTVGTRCMTRFGPSPREPSRSFR